mgnify:CR=1 FL=1
MKKMISVLTMLAVLFTSSFMVSAVTEVLPNETEVSCQYIDSIKESTLEIEQYTKGLNEVTSVNNIETLKTSLKKDYPKLTDYQLGKAVLLALGDDESFIEQLPTEKVLEATEYISAEISVSYLVEGTEGELIPVSKSVFESESPYDYSQYGTDSNDLPKYSETYGKLILKSIVFKGDPGYALEGRTYYSIRGEVEWTSAPNYAYTDALVISSTGNIDNKYDHFVHARWYYSLAGGDWAHKTSHLYESFGGKDSGLEISTPSMYGIGATFPLTHDRSYVIKKAYMYYGVSCQQDITCQVAYAHAKPVWNPSFSISSTGAISFGGLSISRQTFYGTAFTLYY